MSDPRSEPPLPLSAIHARVEGGLETERRQRADEDYLRQRQALTLREVRAQQRWRGWAGFAVFALATAWLIADVVLTLAVGWGTLGGRPFRLEPGVIIAFLTTSTATVIGLFLVFLRWLYPQDPVREATTTVLAESRDSRGR
ncbi:hypothetical protein L1280_000982 [Deinococcus sp. HSC-46F16]|uniref:hypothetical protein n=1 Tax=unclassified Deinococcus TaxID=2623546 RepID=UPI001F330073|nr:MULTISPECIES: hypothetical protein [unclassified Deinococcus]MCP2013854.1 hypothetical protein [Deinococcus sp. HSC-46F16]